MEMFVYVDRTGNETDNPTVAYRRHRPRLSGNDLQGHSSSTRVSMPVRAPYH